MKRLISIACLLSAYWLNGFTQVSQQDSLWKVWEDKTRSDTARIDALAELSTLLLYSEPERRAEILDLIELELEKHPDKKRSSRLLNFRGQSFLVSSRFDSALHYFQKSFEILQELGNLKAIAQIENNIGLVYMYMGDYDNALMRLTASLVKKREVENFASIPSTLMNIGMIYQQRGEHTQALENYMLAYRTDDSLGNTIGAYTSLYHAASVSNEMGNYPQAKEYLLRTLTVAKEYNHLQLIGFSVDLLGAIAYENEDYLESEKYFHEGLSSAKTLGSKYSVAMSMNNLADIKVKLGQEDSALFYYQQSLEIATDIGELSIVSMLYANLGAYHARKQEFDKAEPYMKKGLELDEQMGDFNAVAKSYQSLGMLHLDKKDFSKATDYCLKSYQLAKKDVALPVQEVACECLYKTYKAVGNYRRSFAYLEELRALEDTLMNKERIKELTSLQLNFEHRQQVVADSLQFVAEQQRRDAIAEEKLKRKNQQRNALMGGLGLITIFSGLLYNRFRVTRKQKQVIEVQKEEVEQKNEEILASITYAKKLQTAVLPPARVVKEYFAQSFLLYLPRDIVSGDFYWMENKGDLSFFAVADCTGHGVPGAMLSVIGINGLNRALNEQNLTNPKDILTSLSEHVQKHFEQSEATVRDGMDICLCSLNAKTKKLTFSGANNPVWVARNGEMHILNGDRRAIGHHNIDTKFTQQEFQLQDGDTIYLSSDGYQDQLGGPKTRKLMKKVFREKLTSLSTQPLEKQRETLLSDLEVWKGIHHQTDDICVMGIRV